MTHYHDRPWQIISRGDNRKGTVARCFPVLLTVPWKYIHCKKGKVVLTQFGYLSFLLLVCIVKHSEVPLPALDFKQIKNLIMLSRTLANVMGEYFANEIVQSCGKWYETEVTAMG